MELAARLVNLHSHFVLLTTLRVCYGSQTALLIALNSQLDAMWNSNLLVTLIVFNDNISSSHVPRSKEKKVWHFEKKSKKCEPNAVI